MLLIAAVVVGLLILSRREEHREWLVNRQDITIMLVILVIVEYTVLFRWADMAWAEYYAITHRLFGWP